MVNQNDLEKLKICKLVLRIWSIKKIFFAINKKI